MVYEQIKHFIPHFIYKRQKEGINLYPSLSLSVKFRNPFYVFPPAKTWMSDKYQIKENTEMIEKKKHGKQEPVYINMSEEKLILTFETYLGETRRITVF